MIERGTETFEACAAEQHEAWSHWMAYLLDKCAEDHGEAGLWLDPARVAQWRRQIATPYAELSERERESDREQVDRYAHLVDPASEG